MNKLLSSLIVAAVATISVGAQAASHAGGAPMKADAPAMAASGAKKGDMKKGEMMKDDMKKGDMKKGEMMKDDMKKGDMKKDEMKKDEMKK